MRVRKLDANGDYSFGNQQQDFWKDVPDGPAQCVLTRLYLEQGQWFLDTSEGIPWKTRVLGKYTGETRDAVIRSRILGTQGVTQIDAYSSDLNRETRQFNVSATVSTEYGKTIVTGTI